MSGPIDPQLLGYYRPLDLNTTADQPIIMNFSPGTKYRITKIMATSASAVPTIALGGIYTGPGKTGTVVVQSLQPYATLLTPDNYEDLVLTSSILNTLFSASTLYFSPSLAQGSPATIAIYIYGLPVL